MALTQLPTVEATIQIVHSGPTDGAAFSALLSASDGAPMGPQQVYTFDLNDFAPDLIGASPLVGVFREPSGERVGADVTVEDELITVTFFEDVEPDEYLVKVMG